MKYVGKLYFRGSIVPDGLITDAVIHQRRISIDWNEDGAKGHLESNSSDGINFQGQAYYDGSDRNDFELRKYVCGRDVLLFGTWRSYNLSETGTWNFVLTPAGQEKTQKSNAR